MLQQIVHGQNVGTPQAARNPEQVRNVNHVALQVPYDRPKSEIPLQRVVASGQLPFDERDGNRAGNIIRRIRALTQKAETQKAPVDLNDAIREVMALAESRQPARRQGAAGEGGAVAFQRR